MSLFRSAQMKFYHMHIPKQDAYDVVNKLSQYNFVQFLDASINPLHKPFFNSVKRCEQVIAKIDEITRQLKKNSIPLPQVPIVQSVFENLTMYLRDNKISSMSLLDSIQDDVQAKYQQINKLNKTLSEFQDKITQLEDFKYLLFKARQIFHSKKDQDLTQSLPYNLRLINVSGIILAKDLQKFTKIVFRTTKGNSIVYTFNIPVEQIKSKKQARSAFIVILQSGDVLLSKINRICQSFNAKTYCLPTNKDDVFDKIKDIQDSVTDTRQLCVMVIKNIKETLQQAAEISHFQCGKLDGYRVIYEKQTIIFNTMNLLEQTYKILIAKIWVPKQKVGLLYSIVPSFVSLREMENQGKPPTYFQVNSFTAPYQNIVDTYGIPRYREVNPALYAIPVFPFLFGVMFGDIGHGGVVLAFALWLLYSNSAQKLVPDMYNIRYLLLLMGIFAFYSGWIYNEFFSIPLNVFGTCYEHEQQGKAIKSQGCVYPFGFDPKWIRASNELNFFNSYKMKFAVIIGVVQMSFAIFIKMMNTIHFKAYLDFIFEWLPQQIFFAVTFGYMSFLIIFKWFMPWNKQNSSQAPSIIQQMIALPLELGSTEKCKPLWDAQSQESLQFTLLLICIICIPIMLIPKPIIIAIQIMRQNGSKPKYHKSAIQEQFHESYDNESIEEMKQVQNQKLISKPAPSKQAGHEDISEIAVHQIIQTIEFVLGSISNTASYLRLWALSLAHGQLSRVFLQKTIGGGIESANALIIVIGMYFFFNITLGVIMGMDSLECFLHALRLQWVQFQSKFFKADGWKFEPLAPNIEVQARTDKSRLIE